MSGGKETPRQKMIGMMYLVYTALLAMNVSKDILNAFDIVNTSVQETNISIAQRVNMQYATFESQYNMDKSKVGPYWEQAQEVQKKTDDIINYIEGIKWHLVKSVEKPESFQMALESGLIASPDTIQPNGRKIYNINTSKVKARDNFNEPTAFMIGGDVEGQGEAYVLSKKMKEYRQFILGILGEDHSSELGLITDEKDYTEGAEGGDKIDWEHYSFYHTVLIADVTLFNKIISEIQTAEMNAITVLYQNVHGTDFTFEHIGAKVIAENTYIIQGQNYQADALVTAWKDSKTKAWVLQGAETSPETIMEKGQVIESDSIGTIKLNFPGGSAGEHEYHGIIEMRNPATNEMEHYPFNGKYTVAPPSVTISPIKMNVVYAGLANPIKVSAPGFPDNQVSVYAKGATLSSKGNGLYDLSPNTKPEMAKEVVVTATANDKGKNVTLGSFTFRVKPLPTPNVKIRNVQNDKASIGGLLAAGGIIADMGSDFDFEGVHYDVTSYTLKYKTKSGSNKEVTVKGASFTDEIKNIFNGARRGDMFVFVAIKVKGNDNKEKVSNNSIAVEIE